MGEGEARLVNWVQASTPAEAAERAETTCQVVEWHFRPWLRANTSLPEALTRQVAALHTPLNQDGRREYVIVLAVQLDDLSTARSALGDYRATACTSPIPEIAEIASRFATAADQLIVKAAGGYPATW